MKHLFLSILIYALALCFAISANAETIEVCKDCTVHSIKKAIALAMPYDSIRVQKGIYKEYNINIDKPLTIIGIDYPVIDGEKKGEIVRIKADGVSIYGLKIINVGVSYTTDYAAIRVVRSENFLIQDVHLKKLFFGIYLEKSNHGKILHNTIVGDAIDEYNSGNGIQLWYSKHVVVDGNTVQGTRDGIYLEFSDYIDIKNNKSFDNLRYGLHFMFSNDDKYTHNHFENNGAGVAVMFSRRIDMTGNTFANNWGTAAFGLLLKEIYDAKISHNTFKKNTIGIHIDGSNRIEYTHNNFIQNGWAIKVLGASYDNNFIGNNFLYNAFDVSYKSRINGNVFNKNYWSDYTGYDLDRDGIGDVPYRPVKLFSYIVNRTSEAIILMRSLFIDIIDFSEKVSPIFTPDNLMDHAPLMKKYDKN